MGRRVDATPHLRAVASGAGASEFRRPPHNLEAEQALLGAILVNNEALDRVSGFLSPDHFFDPLHGRIFETLAALIHNGKTATPITVKTFFENVEPIDATMTVPQYLGRLAANATTIINAAEYGRTIYDLATRRSLILIGEDMVNTAYDAAVDNAPRAQIEEAEGKLYTLSESTRFPSLTSSIRTLDDIKPHNASSDLWKGVFGRTEVGTLFAPSQGGKGFFLTEYSKRHCIGRSVFGRLTRASPILQVQYEGALGLDKRVHAAAADLSPEERTLFSRRYAWLPDAAPLGRGLAGDRGVAAIVAAARKLESRAKEPVGLITIDTAAKAMPGESMSDDDSVAVLFDRGRSIRSATGAAVLFVMHPGHENKGRPAGSYQLLGSPDFVIRIAVDAADAAIAIPLSAKRTVSLEKSKDGASGVTLGHFSLREVEIWRDDDGDPVTSCVVIEEEDVAKSIPRQPKLSANQQTMYSILHLAGSQGMALEEWNAKARDAGLGIGRRADLTDYRMALQKHGLVFEGSLGWFAKRDTGS